MPIVRWAPFSAFNSVEREFQSLLDRFNLGPGAEGFSWRPSTDIYRDERGLIVRSEIAGLEPSNLSLEVEGNVLRISGEKRAEHETEEKEGYLKECQYGYFSRDVVLPDGVDPDSITATFENGILEVLVPVPQGAPDEPVRVKIEVNSREMEPA